MKTKILILGDARHGKDTLADILCKAYNLKSKSSSEMALDLFLYDTLVNVYGFDYRTKEEAFKDRINQRHIWYNEITSYNAIDKTRMVKQILNENDIYVGLRNSVEVEQAIEEGLFDHIFGVYNYRVQRENDDSNTADVFKYSQVVFMNKGTIEDLKDLVTELIEI